MENVNKNITMSQSCKTGVIDSFFKEVALTEYIKYGGNLDYIDINKTFTRYGDKNERKPIEKLEHSHFNEKGNCVIYKVFFKDGIIHSYSENWISTLVSFRLSENYL